MSEKRYKIFVRNWWKMENGEKVPDPTAKKKTIGYEPTEENARAHCQRYNALHSPGKLSRKAEFTTNY